MSRANQVMTAMSWIEFAKQSAAEILDSSDGLARVRAEAVIRRLDRAEEYFREALDIGPSESALDAVRAELSKEAA